ncbi:DUF982 domain-containing protein [Phyllobacterium endophyticum]|uniref:DUF982 domain-containing protein n=1 Tax=Phyllobacterium endophyticum TaxID=1149773 RepID=UPI0011CC20F9|nr:DUF982 domain-containing protein [Phyllobacterium endophyticum]TXR48581.1 DUF982 domain-containing protein [Phyllobacterium endophyticum]
MEELTFPRVFVIGPRVDESRGLNSVPAALAFMLEHWPGDTGPKKATALETLRRAIAGDASAEEARADFVHAADEAGILAPPVASG